MNDLETISILQRIANDEQEAFREFFRVYHARLIRFALLFVKSYDDAEDVVSEVMIRLVRKRKVLHEISNFKGYLYQAVKNQSLNFLKKNQHSIKVGIEDIPQDQLTDHHIDPLGTVLTDDLRKNLRSIVDSLPPKRRQVFNLVKNEGFKISEVADLLALSDKTVKKHLELAMRQIRTRVEMLYEEKGSGGTKIIRLGNRLTSLPLLFLSASVMLS